MIGLVTGDRHERVSSLPYCLTLSLCSAPLPSAVLSSPSTLRVAPPSPPPHLPSNQTQGGHTASEQSIRTAYCHIHRCYGESQYSLYNRHSSRSLGSYPPPDGFCLSRPHLSPPSPHNLSVSPPGPIRPDVSRPSSPPLLRSSLLQSLAGLHPPLPRPPRPSRFAN